MDENRGPGRPKKEIKAEKSSVSLYPDHARMADELARRYHGDNFSRLIQKLIEQEWQRVEGKAA